MKLVFGATGHIGGPAARYLCSAIGPERVRVATSRAAMVPSLERDFPGSEAVCADMLDVISMAAALNDVDAVFIVTPDLFDDRAAADVLVAAARQAQVAPHIVRITAEIPGVGVSDLPGVLAQPIGRRGHLEAREIIEQSGFPASFLAIVAYYMDDLLMHFAPTLSQGRLVVPFDRPMAWIDPVDVGEAAARLMIATPPIAPQLLPINSGEDGILFSALAARIAHSCGKPVSYVDDERAFRDEIGPLLAAMTGSDALTDYLLADWQLEREHPREYDARPLLETLLGRAPKRLDDWLDANAERLVR